MKNFATRLITLLCVFCLIFTFASCQKDDNKKGKDEDVKGEEVTKDEWTAAFALSNVENMEIKITENFSELDKENNEKYQESLSIDAVYKNGTVSFEVTEKEDGETDYYGPYEEDVFGNTLWGIFDAIGDISFSDLTEIVHPSIHTPPSLESCSNFYSYFVPTSLPDCH